MPPTRPTVTPMLFKRGEDFPQALKKYLKEVGRGKKGARNLTREQARDALTQILAGRASDAQIGALFQAFRIKAETPEELAGMIEAARETCGVAPGESHPLRIELGLPYDGRLRGFHVLPFAALLAARAGVQTFFHGSAGVGPKFGINAVEVLHAMGYGPAPSVAEAIGEMERTGIASCLQKTYSPALARLRPLRNEVVLRGPLATVEKMLNLSGAAALIAGNTHTAYAGIMSGAFGLMIGDWPGAEAWVVQAGEGHPDLDPRRETSARHVTADGGVEDCTFASGAEVFPETDRDRLAPPAAPEVDPLDPDSRARWIEANVAWGRSVLNGEEALGLPALLSTTGLLLLAAKLEADHASAVRRARTLLDSGSNMLIAER